MCKLQFDRSFVEVDSEICSFLIKKMTKYSLDNESSSEDENYQPQAKRVLLNCGATENSAENKAGTSGLQRKHIPNCQNCNLKPRNLTTKCQHQLCQGCFTSALVPEKTGRPRCPCCPAIIEDTFIKENLSMASYIGYLDAIIRSKLERN